MKFEKFDRQNPPEDGLYWVAIERLEYDVDVDDYGKTIGTPTGKTQLSTALVWIDSDGDDITFDPVDSTNLGKVADDDIVRGYCLVECPKTEDIKLPS